MNNRFAIISTTRSNRTQFLVQPYDEDSEDERTRRRFNDALRRATESGQ
jgi:hypothetical protein